MSYETPTGPRKAPILLVEDDDVDVEAVKRALQKENIDNQFHCATDGIAALDLLTGKNGEKISQPCIILLDINMPRMNGLQLLQEIRRDQQMKQNVVFMLTTSSRDSDKITAYNYQAAGYVLKENLKQLVSNVLSGYCRINELP